MTNFTKEQIPTPAQHPQKSEILADYLLKGWRIVEVESDYRSVLIMDRNNQKKYIPFNENGVNGVDVQDTLNSVASFNDKLSSVSKNLSGVNSNFSNMSSVKG